MIRYRYKAISEGGRAIHGTISAENENDLEYILKKSDLRLVSYKIQRKSNLFSLISFGLSTKDLVTLFTHFQQLEKIGVPILDSIADIKNSSDSTKIRDLMQEIYEAVKNGNLFSEALAKHPKIFIPVFIGLIANGEKTGNLSDVFASIIDHLKWSSDIKRKTIKAIRYPLFSLGVMMMVIWTMTTIVVPRITTFLESQEIKLPLATRALVGFSHFVTNNGLLIIASMPIIFIIYKFLRQLPEFALKIDQMKLYIPLFGSIITKIDTSRFCHFFAMNFKGGIGVLDCLESAKNVINNYAIKQSIEIVKQQVADGHSLSAAIAYTGYFPNLIVRMFKIGEDSGNMEENLRNVRFFYDQEINDSVEKIVGMIQPTLTLVMGGLMAWITLSVFGPIYSTFSTIR